MAPWLARAHEHTRVRELEGQVSELESEATRLSRSLDARKAEAQEFEAAANRKTEELSKELITKVVGFLCYLCYPDRSCSHQRSANSSRSCSHTATTTRSNASSRS
jgi:outer membrane murein-binding lipoprotein Lpp